MKEEKRRFGSKGIKKYQKNLKICEGTQSM